MTMKTDWVDRMGHWANQMVADMDHFFGDGAGDSDDVESHPQTPGCYDKRTSYDVTKSEDGVTIRVGVPGCTLDDIELDLKDAIINVRVNAGFRPGQVKRFRVHKDTEVGDIIAVIKSGLLTITVNKDEVPDRPSGKIPVS